MKLVQKEDFKDIIIELINHHFNHSPLKKSLLKALETYSYNSKGELFQFSRFVEFLSKIEGQGNKEKIIFQFALIYQNKFAINFLEDMLGLPKGRLSTIIMHSNIEAYIDSLSIKHRILYFFLLQQHDKYDKDLRKKLKISKKVIKKNRAKLIQEGFISYN